MVIDPDPFGAVGDYVGSFLVKGAVAREMTGVGVTPSPRWMTVCTPLAARTSMAVRWAADKIGTDKLFLMGHSAGGGGTLTATRDDPTLKAAIPMTPASTSSDFSGITVPTLILACEKDAIAPNKTFSAKYYATMSASTERAYLEVAGADHLCPLDMAKDSVNNTVGQSVISWLKRFVDGDRRYAPFLTGAALPTYSKVDVHITP